MWLAAAILSATLVAASGITLPAFPGAPTDQDALQCFFEKPILSCSNATLSLTSLDTCCVPTPGGLVLQTQFWDTYTGLESSGQLLPDQTTWTIHGLWPDFCDGSFPGYCDLSRQFDPAPSPNKTDDGQPIPPYTGLGVDTFIKAFGRQDLLDYMNTFWVSQGQPNVDFWGHEFSKHATCFSTYDTKCYFPYFEHMEVVDFYESVIRAYKQHPTGAWLASANITPSNSTSYTLSDLQNALKAASGAIPYLGCGGPKDPSGGRTVLQEVWYFSHVLGTTQRGDFHPLDSVTTSTCTNATGAIHYYERTPGSIRN